MFPVDYLKIVPTHFQALLAGSEAAKITPRKALVLGGDTSQWALVDQIQREGVRCKIINHYGPTETTVGCLTFDIPCSPVNRLGQSVPIGRPLGNNRIYVLDSLQRLSPVGSPGELYIGGPTVGRGYLGQPALTAERFIPDTFSGISGGRLYRTGDRARLLQDGTIEFLGRKDYQVKVRGYRVELSEIEKILTATTEVNEAAAILRSDDPASSQLVAYVTISEELKKKQSIELRQVSRDLQKTSRGVFARVYGALCHNRHSCASIDRKRKARQIIAR